MTVVALFISMSVTLGGRIVGVECFIFVILQYTGSRFHRSALNL